MRTLRTLFGLLGLVAVGTLSACETVEGFGRDLERGGEKLQGEAREHDD